MATLPKNVELLATIHIPNNRDYHLPVVKIYKHNSDVYAVILKSDYSNRRRKTNIEAIRKMYQTENGSYFKYRGARYFTEYQF